VDVDIVALQQGGEVRSVMGLEHDEEVTSLMGLQQGVGVRSVMGLQQGGEFEYAQTTGPTHYSSSANSEASQCTLTTLTLQWFGLENVSNNVRKSHSYFSRLR